MASLTPSDTDTRFDDAEYQPSSSYSPLDDNELFLKDLDNAEYIIESGSYDSEQQEVMLDMIATMKILDAQIKNAKKIPGLSAEAYEEELKLLAAKLKEVEGKGGKNQTYSILAAGQRSAQEIERELANDPKYKTLATLVNVKDASNNYNDLQIVTEPAKRAALVEEVKTVLSKEMKEMIKGSALNEKDSQRLYSEIPQEVERITAENTKNNKLNIFQKVMVWFNLNVLNKDYRWLNKYLQKTGITDQKEIRKFIKDNYSEIHEKAVEEGLIPEKDEEETRGKEEPNRERARAPRIEDTRSPLRPAATENKPSPLPDKNVKDVVHEVEQMFNAQETRFVDMAKTTPEMLVKAQKGVETCLEEVVAADATLPIPEKIRNVTTHLTREILDHNVSLDIDEDNKVDVQRFYSAPLMQALDLDPELKKAVNVYRRENELEATAINQEQIEATLKSHEGSPEFRSAFIQIKRSVSTIETLRAHRAAEGQLLINWLTSAQESAKTKVSDHEGKNSELYRDRVEKNFSNTFVDHLLGEIDSLHLNASSRPEVNILRAKYQKLIESGVISVQMMVDENGFTTPMLLVKDYQDENGNLIASEATLNELTGGKSAEDPSKLAVAYQFTLTGKNEQRQFPLQCVALSLKTKRESVSEQQAHFDENLRHEMEHSKRAAKNEAYKAAINEVFSGVTERNMGKTWSKGLVDRLALKGITDTELIKKAINLYTTEDPWKRQQIINSDQQDGPVLAGILSEIESDVEESHKNNPNKKHILEVRRELYQQGMGHILDELQALNGDYRVSLNDIYIDNYNPRDKEQQTALTLMRLLNTYTDKINASQDNDKVQRLRANRAYLVEYFASSMGSALEPISAKRMIRTLLEAADAPVNPDVTGPYDTLHSIITEDLAELTTPPIPGDLANALIDNAKTLYLAKHPDAQDFTWSEEQWLELTNGINILLKGDEGGSPESRKELVDSLTKMFSQYDGARIQFLDLFLSGKNPELIASLIAQAVMQPDESEYNNISKSGDEADINFRRRNNIEPPIRLAVENLASAVIGTEIGKGMGNKLPLGAHIIHPKDTGPWFLSFGGWNAKTFHDNFGIGTNEFRTWDADMWEGLYYLTGISVHKIPWLRNTPKYLEQIKAPGFLKNLDTKTFEAKALWDASPDRYSYETINTIFQRVASEKFYNPQALIEILMHIGGYEYDATGNPVQAEHTFGTKEDQYRLSSNMADFVLHDIYGHAIAVNGTNDVLLPENIRDMVSRMRKDQMYYQGNLVEVEERDGKIYTVNGNHLVKDGKITIGQMSQNLLEEIKEIMVYGDQNTNLSEPAWKLGKGMEDYSKKLKDPQKKLERMGEFEHLAELMMAEDDIRRRRDPNTSYTIEDLLVEMRRVQQLPYESFFDNHGHVDPNKIDPKTGKTVRERYIDPKIKVGGSDVSLAVAKDFIKEFSLARAQKILSVGVWERLPEKKVDKNNQLLPPLSHDEFITLTTGNKNGNNPLLPGVITHDIPEKPLQSIVEIRPQVAGGQTKYIWVKYNRYTGTQYFEVNGTELKYDKNAKITFTIKQTGAEFDIDPAKGMTPEILLRYFGKKDSLTYINAAGNQQTVVGREGYTTEKGQMFDDVYDEITKVKMGRELSYKFSRYLYDTDKYRDYAKQRKELFEGYGMIESFIRNGILIASVIGILYPPLAFLMSPNLLIGTILWSITGHPFLSRTAKGWAARFGAAIQAQGNMASMAGEFFAATNEKQPLSFGQLQLLRSQLENVKFQYRSVLKSFKEGAQWKSNPVNHLVSMAMGKVLG